MDKYPLMMKGLAVGIILLFLGTNVFSSTAQELKKSPLPTSSGKWLYVGGSGPGNYTRIQDAINDSQDGDTVFVFPGTYNETIEIRTAICLMGGDINTTIIQDVSNYTTWYTVTVDHQNVTITGFTIKGLQAPYALGLIKGYSTIKGNTIISKIYTWWSNNNSLVDNKIIGHVIVDGFGNVLDHNYIESGWPLELALSNNTLSNNTFISTGLQAYGGVGNIVVNNTVNGKPLVYLDQVSNQVVEEDAGQIVLVACKNVTIRNQHFTNVLRAIQVLGSTQCYLINNTINQCSTYGIEIYTSDTITIMHNIINTSLIQIGQWDFGYNNNIVISRNTFTSASLGDNSISIGNTYNSTLSYNNLVNTAIELAFYDRNCQICCNNFLTSSFILIEVGHFPHIRFNHNYWERPRFFPKFNFGITEIFGGDYPEQVVPWLFIDWHPRLIPNDIS